MAYRKKHPLLGAYLKAARIKSGLSQRDVSKKMKYTGAQFVSNWERGLTPVPIRALKKIVPLYDLSPIELIEILIEEEHRYLTAILLR